MRSIDNNNKQFNKAKMEGKKKLSDRRTPTRLWTSRVSNWIFYVVTRFRRKPSIFLQKFLWFFSNFFPFPFFCFCIVECWKHTAIATELVRSIAILSDWWRLLRFCWIASCNQWLLHVGVEVAETTGSILLFWGQLQFATLCASWGFAGLFGLCLCELLLLLRFEMKKKSQMGFCGF